MCVTKCVGPGLHMTTLNVVHVHETYEKGSEKNLPNHYDCRLHRSTTLIHSKITNSAGAPGTLELCEDDKKSY
jgi:hypothetical protein